MQTERTFTDELKFQLKHGGMHIRLIFANLIIFLVIGIGMVTSHVTKNHTGEIESFLFNTFTLRSSFGGLIEKPWGLITSMFAHFGFMHFVFNMLFLFFSGQIFLQFFTGRRLLHLYIISGIAGGLFEILARELLPISPTPVSIVGASGSVMAIFTAIAVYRPRLQVNFFSLRIPVYVIAIVYLLSDLVKLGSDDKVAHFAHLGGALVGALSVVNLHSSTNIINMSESVVQKIKVLFSNLFRPKPKMRAERGGVRGGKSDEQYNMEAKERQKKIDAILDKISKSGYESLTKAEKEFLFSQSKNG